MDGHEIRKVMCDEARDAFKDAGLTYGDLTLSRISLLRDVVDRYLRESMLMKGTYKADKKVVLKFMPNGVFGTVTCRSHYFEKREAIAFNPDGFIGFAGWADPVHIVPVVSAFREWVTLVAAEKGAANPTVLLDLPWRQEPLRVPVSEKPRNSA